MISPISFGSTYKAYITRKDTMNSLYGHGSLVDFCERKDIPIRQSFDYREEKIPGSGGLKTVHPKYVKEVDDYVFSTYTVVAPDKYDAKIEDICAANGITYRKLDDELMKPEEIKKRINPAKKGYVLASVNAEKLLGLTVTQRDNNLEHCRKDYNYYFKTKTNSVIKSGDPFDASTLHIKYADDDGTNESLKRYVDAFGKESLNNDSISMYLSQRNKTDTNIFYGLMALGMEDIPVYLDKESYKNAKTLGLLSE